MKSEVGLGLGGLVCRKECVYCLCGDMCVRKNVGIALCFEVTRSYYPIYPIHLPLLKKVFAGVNVDP